MPIGIVHFFKVIQIEINHAHLRFTPGGDGVGDQLMDGISVRQTGNRIRIGENAQALLGPALFRDVGT